MDIYILDEVVKPSELRSTVASEIRKNAHVTDPKVPPPPSLFFLITSNMHIRFTFIFGVFNVQLRLYTCSIFERDRTHLDK